MASRDIDATPVDDTPVRTRRGTTITIGDSSSGQTSTESNGSITDDTGLSSDYQETFVERPRRRTKASKTAAKGSADMLIGLIETAGRFRYGPDRGSMTPQERGMMVEGFTGSMASLPADVVQKISDMSAPVMALTGLLMYTYRMALNETALKQSRAAEDRTSAVLTAQQIVNKQREQTPPVPPVIPTQPAPNGTGGIPGAHVPTKSEIMDLVDRGDI